MKQLNLAKLGAWPIVISALALSAQAQTGYEWGREFDAPSLAYGEVKDAVMFDDGTGPALYIAGEFIWINGEAAWSVAKYDGKDWSPLGGGLTIGGFSPADVQALEVFDIDGAGPQPAVLVASGTFGTANGTSTKVKNVASWDGTSWSAMGGGITVPYGGWSWPEVSDLQTFDDGTGPKLYAAGIFKFGTGKGAAVWDGTSWSAVGFGGAAASGWTSAMAVFNDGTGDALYYGGNFSQMGAPNTQYVSRWDGTNWSSPGATFTQGVDAFTLFDADGAGPLPAKLVAAGAGDLDVFDGTSVTHVVGFNSGLSPALMAFDDGTGPAVYLGANSFVTPQLHRWDGVSSTMTPIGSIVQQDLTNSVAFMETLFEYQGQMWGGGLFKGTMTAPSPNLMKWDGTDWADPFPRGGFSSEGLVSGTRVEGVVTYNIGQGEELYAGGSSSYAGNTPLSNGLAAWNGNSWRDTGAIPGTGAILNTDPLATWDDGTGEALYVSVNRQSGNQIYKLNASGWSEVGAASASFPINPPRHGIVYDDGTGSALYVTSDTTVQKWDGTTWTVVGTANNNQLYTLEVFDAGSGPELYLGGHFQSINGVAAKFLAKYDGTSWNIVPGSNLNSNVSNIVIADDGSGLAMFIGGAFTSAGGISGTTHVARFDGTNWSSVGGGEPGDLRLLGAHNDGVTTRIYAAVFDFNQTFWGAHMRSWDGTAWASVPNSFTTGGMIGMTDFNDGKGAGAYIWGNFMGTGGTVINPATTIDTANQSSGIVRWGTPSSPFVVSGTGCSMYSSDIPEIQGGGLAQLGSSSFVTSVKNVPAGLPAALIIGTDTNFWMGIPLPLDLAVMGWAGCNLYQSWNFTFWTVTGGVGTTGGVASLPLVIPSQSSLVGLNLGMQWAVISPALAGIDVGVTPLGEVVIE